MLRLAAGPSETERETETVSPTEPAKPRRLVRVTVEFADDPCTTVTEGGLETMEKSGGNGKTRMGIETERAIPLATPVTTAV